MQGPRSREPEEIIRRHQNQKAKIRGTIMEQKRTTNLLAGLCAVLFVISFIMGVGLIRNQDRLDNNDAQIRQLTTALKNYMTIDMTEHTPVFAESEIPETVYTTPDLPSGIQEIEAPVIIQEPSPTVTAPIPTASPVTSTDITIMSETETSALITPIPETYTIQPGDSLLAISLYFFGDANMVNEILQLNGIENPDHIIAGRTLALPRR
jgi:LysM repeat protein